MFLVHACGEQLSFEMRSVCDSCSTSDDTSSKQRRLVFSLLMGRKPGLYVVWSRNVYVWRDVTHYGLDIV